LHGDLYAAAGWGVGDDHGECVCQHAAVADAGRSGWGYERDRQLRAGDDHDHDLGPVDDHDEDDNDDLDYDQAVDDDGVDDPVARAGSSRGLVLVVSVVVGVPESEWNVRQGFRRPHLASAVDQEVDAHEQEQAHQGEEEG
jgi:hypothetical protein